ncbi:carboxypeptidase-like regulatory domain-containing protein [Isoptericola sp. NEAU-Y5]|uniref:Carboxypeptidase-like regulatory domain-containing protein n=1 Tax=Isoptericola luteus TaxID=2879484 RepID=A0ABS7ZCA3_9MICO|nr:carboxypeptidase-like regulatory domain-containing protein [Isoptericola sp. NEAU-Y5]MCA5892681.1 carboxypeptidase-like regulatory domain-containing protein [Isoptericola sp. NEAU-Y5]
MNSAQDGTTSVPGEAEPLDAWDMAVLGRLARVVEERDPVPDGLVERSLFAMTLAGLEAEVMELQRIDVPVGAVRSGQPLEARTVTFTHERLTVMIALSAADDGVSVRVDGWIAPAGPRAVELRQPGTTLETTADDDGRFVFEAVEPGSASFLVRLPGGTPVTTPVVEL